MDFGDDDARDAWDDNDSRRIRRKLIKRIREILEQDPSDHELRHWIERKEADL